MRYFAIAQTASLKPLVKKTMWDKNLTKEKEYNLILSSLPLMRTILANDAYQSIKQVVQIT